MEPFTENEQRFVLAEIIKTSQIDVRSLVGFIKSQNVDADWRNMQIPHGQPSESRCGTARIADNFQAEPSTSASQL